MVGKILDKEKVVASPLVKVFNCTNCGGSIKIRALGMTLMVVCPACGTAVNSLDENLAVIEKFKQEKFSKIKIPLGARGKVRGDLWEVIGYMERSDTKFYFWSEYLLFNPKKGFRWLSENNGHWTWVLPLKTNPIGAPWSTSLQYGSTTYKLFHQGRANITYIIGEFYWQAKVGDVTQVEDYVSAPEILSLEKSANEKHWSLGEYLEYQIVEKAFKLTDLQKPEGVAPNQPWDRERTVRKVMEIWVFSLILLFVIQMLSVATSENKNIFDINLRHDGQNPAALLVSEPFSLNKEMANIKFILYAPIENQWLSTEVELVNDTTGESQEYEVGVEFYQGYDGGESWSEGSRTGEVVIPSVPGGTYHVNLKWQSSQMSPIDFNLKMRRDVPQWSDFLWSIFWITLFPIFIFWRSTRFEMKRWEESDFSPYHGQDDEDE